MFLPSSVAHLVDLSLQNSSIKFTPSSPELFHPPGLFKVDKVANKHWYWSFLMSLNQIQFLEAIDREKKLGQKIEKKTLAFLKKKKIC